LAEDVRGRVADFWGHALAHSRQLAFVMTCDRQVLAVSQGMCDALGLTSEELIGHRCAALMHADGRPPGECPLHDLLADDAQEYADVHSDVLGKDLFITVTPLPDETGQVREVLHVASDVTERRRVEGALRESEQRFASLFHDAPLGYQSLDEQGRLVEVNERWLETLGYARDEVLGRWFGDFLAPGYEADFRRRFPLFKKMGATHSEFEMLRRDGERLTIAFEGRIGRNPDGSFRQTHCILSDITERSRAEAALRESEALLRESQRVARLGHYVLNVPGGTWTSSAMLDEIFGIDEDYPRTVEGWLQIAHPEERTALASYLEGEVLGLRRGFDREYRIQRISDGAERWLHGVGQLELDADGLVSQMFGVIQDVTEQYEARSALERSARLLEEAEHLAHLGSWEWDVEKDRTRYSKEWQRIYGVDRDEMPNDESLKLVHPEDVPVVLAARATVLGEGSSYHAEYRIVRQADGDVRHVEAFGVAGRDVDGKVTRVFGASFDVTDRVAAERELLEREAHGRRLLSGIVSALATTIEKRDPYTSGHQRRVAELAVAIARQLQWGEARAADLRTAALLHDIGKVVVPAEILTKPTLLSASEFELIKGHPLAASEILDTVEFPLPIKQGIAQHHERLNGTGYPCGLKGEAIIPEARAIAVADVYEAMVSHRPYRPALPPEVAIAELREGASVLYDADVVDACLALTTAGFQFRQS